MDLPEGLMHSFIVRVWLDDDSDTPARWRGTIIHVMSNQRAYVTSLSEINRFISHYLDQMGAGEGSHSVPGG